MGLTETQNNVSDSTVLVAEDDPNDVSLLKWAFSTAGVTASSFPEKGSAEHLSKIGLLLSAVKSQHVFAGRRASYVGLRLGRRGAGCLAHWLVYHVRACKILNPSDKTCAPGGPSPARPPNPANLATKIFACD